MTELGCFLSSEEHGPRALLEQAQMAERAGFEKVSISDHFHPWMDSQGHSPFVWSAIGAIGAATNLEITTAVTCPILRATRPSSPRPWRHRPRCSTAGSASAWALESD